MKITARISPNRKREFLFIGRGLIIVSGAGTDIYNVYHFTITLIAWQWKFPYFKITRDSSFITREAVREMAKELEL